MEHLEPQQESVHAAPAPRRPAARSENPELWDLEHEYERRRTEQLAEAWQKSARVVDLMARLETLEPLTGELAALREAYDDVQRARAELRESHRMVTESLYACEDAKRACEAESEGRRVELERAGAERAALCERVGALEGDAERRERERQALEVSHREAREGLERTLAERASELERRAAQIAGLDDVVRERDQALADAQRALRERENELESVRAELTTRTATIQERDAALYRLGQEASGLRAERDALQTTLATVRDDNAKLDQAWRGALSQSELDRAERRKREGHLAATLAALTEIRPMLRALETKLQPQTPEPPPALPSSASASAPTAAA